LVLRRCDSDDFSLTRDRACEFTVYKKGRLARAIRGLSHKHKSYQRIKDWQHAAQFTATSDGSDHTGFPWSERFLLQRAVALPIAERKEIIDKLFYM
jgi:hypothetical protein